MSELTDNPPSSRESTPNDQLQTPDHSAASTSPEQDERTPEIVKLSKSKGASALDKYYSEDDEGMFFLNLQQAVAATDHAQWYAPRPDDTIPVNEDQDRQVVRRLVDAFLDTSGAMDTEGNAYRKRFTPGTNVFYDTWTIERCAWEVLGVVKTIHQDGFRAHIFDVEMLKSIGQTELWTFDDRIGMICRVLKVSKSVAVSLMKHEKIWTIIGAPHKLYNSTLVNNQSNAFRNKWVKAGREAEKGRSNSETSDTPSTKRRRMMTKPVPRKTSATIVPSPLAKSVPVSSSPSVPSPSPTFIKQENATQAASSPVENATHVPSQPAQNAAHVVSSPAQNSPQDVDVKMTDAVPKVSVKKEMGRGSTDGRDKVNQNSNNTAKAHSSLPPASMTSSTISAPADRLGTNSLASTSIFPKTISAAPARPQCASADVDAAELLLGLRRTS